MTSPSYSFKLKHILYTQWQCHAEKKGQEGKLWTMYVSEMYVSGCRPIRANCQWWNKWLCPNNFTPLLWIRYIVNAAFFVSERWKKVQDVTSSWLMMTNVVTNYFTHIISLPCTMSHIHVALLMQLPLHSFQIMINACFRKISPGCHATLANDDQVIPYRWQC